jgi:hypothetical protein
MECIVKICVNVSCVVTAFFDIDGSNPVTLLYSVCIKTIDYVKHLDFIQWHVTVSARVLQLPFVFFNMLQQVLSQLQDVPRILSTLVLLNKETMVQASILSRS